MRNHLFVMFFLLPFIVLAQKKTEPELKKSSLIYKEGLQRKTSNSTQKRKCFYCNGVGKIKDNVTIACKNCKDWNMEYRKKVACHICRDDRTITRVELVDCRNCQNGLADKTPWDCIDSYNHANDIFDLLDRGDYKYEIVDNPQNGLETVFMYYKDGTLVWAYLKDKNPISRGSWKCEGGKAYSITINGKTINYGLGK